MAACSQGGAHEPAEVQDINDKGQWIKSKMCPKCGYWLTLDTDLDDGSYKKTAPFYDANRP